MKRGGRLRVLRLLLIGTPVALATVWACAAIRLDAPLPPAISAALVGGFAVAALALLAFLRPARRGLFAFGLLFAAVLAWWLSLEPSNRRDWQPDVARLTTATIEGDLVTLRNVRNFVYRTETDFSERWEDRVLDLSKLGGVDFYLSYWGSPWIAHTIVSWTFEDAPPLAISIETRKEKGESYSALRGFFRQYELYYVVADERDLVALRTNHRGEDVYRYRLRTPVPEARAILLDYLREVNRLAEEPRWYNAATHNCTTTIRQHVDNVAADRPWDWRVLVNGYIDQLGYERGTIETDLPFEQTRRRAAISERARAIGVPADFSRRIREQPVQLTQ